MMNTNRNSGTKKATAATSSSMNPPLSAQGREEGRQGGRLRIGSGGNTPNNHTSNTRTPSSSLSSPVTPSTGIVTENGSCQNALMTMVSPPAPAEDPKTNRGSCTHKLQEVKIESEGQLESNGLTETQRKQQRQRNLMLHIQLIEHASGCTSPSCTSKNCAKMKEYLQHARTCKTKVVGGCRICKRIWTLFRIHAQKCKKPVCPIPQCMISRGKMRELQKPPPPSIPDPQDECVLCCYLLPLPNGTTYHDCCGKVICNGCLIAQRRVLIIGTNVEKPIKGSKEEEREFMMILCSKLKTLCPFCRARVSKNEERLKRLHTRINKYKDSTAMLMLGRYYLKGEHGLSKNLTKAEEFYQQAYNLGHSHAAYNLYQLHLSKHVPDEVLMRQYLEEGVRRGNSSCMRILADKAARSGNYKEAARLYMIAARSGDDDSMHNLMVCYQRPGSLVSLDDLKTTLRAHKAANDKVKSEPREYAMRYQVFRAKRITTRKLKAVGNVVL